jgi:hypothetical protein
MFSGARESNYTFKYRLCITKNIKFLLELKGKFTFRATLIHTFVTGNNNKNQKHWQTSLFSLQTAYFRGIAQL